MKADHNTITPFGIKVMSKYMVLSKRELGMIKKNTLQTPLYKHPCISVHVTRVWFSIYKEHVYVVCFVCAYLVFFTNNVILLFIFQPVYNR